ncbi:carbohydrate ABC transporter permease [Gracilibacillus salinarum]|uniref:Carbohydrate ABC transporter permease n=1 Tax=Gracilibacillus salinarum TaxID=2932255 RepID=A0ABY4GKL2_9BACI|nr:carbohydrate ABC transporter permease [Gracilibacillus salinarum]UOQ84766.1 carbohydrate ABC transporter permease [Gracilibacillus salinarum]
MRKKIKAKDWLLLVLTIVVSIIIIFPVLFAFMSAFKSNGEILADPLALPSSFGFDNFQRLFEETNFLEAFTNSVIITICSLFLIVLIIPMAAYPLARQKGKFYYIVYVYFIMSFMIPFQTYMIPLFEQLDTLGLLGNLYGVINQYIAFSVSLSVLLYTSFIRGIPYTLEEAAEIDGANKFTIFWKIIFPLVTPTTVTIIVLQGLGIWNDFLLPLLVMSGMDVKTINVEIYQFIGLYSAQWGILFAGTVIAMTPMIIFFTAAQRYFVKGITAGAVKA